MKTKSTLLLALSLGFASLSTASAGLITDPLGVQAPVIDQGLTTDPLGNGGPKHLAPPQANVPAASQFLASAIANGKTVRLSDLMLNPEFFAAAHAAGLEADALRGQIDWLMMSGVILEVDGDDGLDDLTGDAGDDVDGDDGLDDLMEDAGDDVLNWSWGASNPAIILGGPGSDTLKAPINGFVFGTTSYLQPAPLNWSRGETNFFTDILVSDAVPPPVNGFSFGTTQSLHQSAAPANGIILGGPGSDTIILGGPGNDTLAPYIQPSTIQPPVPGIILGGPGNDTIILGGPGNDTLMPTGAFYIPPTLK